MAGTPRRAAVDPGAGGWRRHALALGVYGAGAALACLLWAGVALPALRFVPLLESGSRNDIAISLQSALLGIDDGQDRPSAAARSARRALGLTGGEPVLAELLGARHTLVPAPLVARLAASLAAPLAAPSAAGEVPDPHSTPAAASPTARAPVPAPAAFVAEVSVPQTHAPAPPAAPAAPDAPVPPQPPALPAAPAVPDPAPKPTPPQPAAPSAPTPPPARDPLPQRLDQRITFSSAPPDGAIVGRQYVVSASASSGLPVRLSTESGEACSISRTTVSFVGAGTCTLVADQPGNAKFKPAPQARQSFAVTLVPQTISFTSSAPDGARVGDVYTVAASASSGLPVSFGGGTAGVCAVDGSAVSLVGPGLCTVLAEQAGDSTYAAAPSASQSFAVAARGPSRAKAVQTIQFLSTPPASTLVGDPAYSVSAHASSGLPVDFSADAASAGICTVTGSTVTAVGVGLCVVDADQSGDDSYEPAARVRQSFAIGAVAPVRSVQSITFVSPPPAGAVVGGAGYAVAASASSGLPVAFSSATPDVCTVSGSTVSFVGPGTCTIDADQPGDAAYLAAPQSELGFPVGLAAQTITFSTLPPVSAAVGDPAYIVAATASSGLPVSFGADASSVGVCTVTGSTVRIVGTGTCTIDADQPGDALHAAAPQVNQSFEIGAASPSLSVQSITFTSSAPAGATVGGSYAAAASASSGLAVSFSSGSPAVCTVSGAAVSFVATGTCVVRADQPGNASYRAAPQVTQSFPVALATQAISFSSAPPVGAVVGGAAYQVSASATSGLAVTFSSGSPAVCSVSGSTVSFAGAGTCVVRANQAGNASYQAAPQAQQSFAVGGRAQTISFTSSPPAPATVGGAAYAVSATATSGLPVSFASGTPSVCTVSGTTVSFAAAGTCTVRANQAGNGAYQPAPQVQQSFSVAPAASPQAIAFTSSPPAGAVFGGAPYAVSASASSGLSVSFSTTTPGVCTVSGASVSFVAGGTCTVAADQAGNASWQAAPQVQQTFTVARAAQTITITSDPGRVDRYDPPYAIVAVASSGLPVTFTADAASAGVCSVSGSTVSFEARGTCTIYGDQAGDARYLPAPQATQSFPVKNHTPG